MVIHLTCVQDGATAEAAGSRLANESDLPTNAAVDDLQPQKKETGATGLCGGIEYALTEVSTVDRRPSPKEGCQEKQQEAEEGEERKKK